MIKRFEDYLSETKEVGFVDRIISSLVYVEGLPGAFTGEMVIFESGVIGQVMALAPGNVEIFCFSRHPISIGERVTRTKSVLELSVGEDLLGTSIDPLGHSLDPAKPVPPLKRTYPFDILPPGLASRARITKPCATGITLIDRLIPIGKGQRELILGDQKTGKSRFLLRAMLSQVKQGSIGIYALIGKGKLAIRQTEQTLIDFDIRSRTVLVASTFDDTAGLIYLTPYAAMAMAEYFRDQGNDVLLVLDDLSLHAKMYREISLAAKKFPGRNSYPGDIFYAHAKLMERAGNFSTPKGEFAITCLPVVEAPQGDLTGYIQTNTMAMTDGHILFDHILFAEGRRPAINIFLSVTRVGKQTQSLLEREIAQTLLIFLKEAQRLHQLTSFGAELGEHITQVLQKEERVMEYLDQTAYDVIPVSLQVCLFGLVWGNLWEGKSRQDLQLEIQRIIYAYEGNPTVRKRIDDIASGSASLEGLLVQTKNFYHSLPASDASGMREPIKAKQI